MHGLNRTIVMNRVLDRTLREFDSRDKEIHRTSLTRRRQKIKTLREWLATSLEDPSVYRVAGDAQFEIHRMLAGNSRLDQLQQMLLGKLELLERIYQDIVALRMLDVSPDPRAEWMD